MKGGVVKFLLKFHSVFISKIKKRIVTFNSLYQYLCFDVVWCSVSLKKGFGTIFFSFS